MLSTAVTTSTLFLQDYWSRSFMWLRFEWLKMLEMTKYGFMNYAYS